MQQLIWITIAALGGIAAILGSLMALGSLLLWFVPALKIRQSSQLQSPSILWQRLRLSLAALGLMAIGFSLLKRFPLPSAQNI